MEKISKLRALLEKQNLDCYLIPMRDKFGSEYLPTAEKRIEFLTGFTGSNAFVVITKEKAAFFPLFPPQVDSGGRLPISEMNLSQKKSRVDKKILKGGKTFSFKKYLFRQKWQYLFPE